MTIIINRFDFSIDHRGKSVYHPGTMQLDSSYVISVILDELFGPQNFVAHQMLIGILDRVSESVKATRPGPFDTIVHKGLIFRIKPTTYAQGIPAVISPTPEFYPVMEEYLDFEHRVRKDATDVKSLMALMFASCCTEQDYRDTLPDFLYNRISSYFTAGKSTRRTRPPACTIAENPRAMKLYDRLVPIMERYDTQRLIMHA